MVQLQKLYDTDKNNMRVAKMKDCWDTKDSKLVINDRMTELGLTTYWLAVNATIKFNVQRREAFMCKKQVVPGKPLEPEKTAEKLERHTSLDRGRSYFNEDRRHHHDWRDLMPSFFRRRQYVDHHMDDHEDWCGQHQVNNRFFLPRPKHF